ncbi:MULTISPECIES: RagB/SusD family nutrient uptake outer membrane protein [unclassified Saccharicrinis]|uniref:RagB/SusD family nutrient uptake outer membrane protein n=1 Tax=unclassified Saccharicrinis TaxID=2646859 RepID=UPI003D3563F4
MKILKYITTVFLATFIFFSCNEDEWLEEEVLDFYSIGNSYVTADQFNAAVATLYDQMQDRTIMSNLGGMYIFQYTSDIAYNAIAPTNALNSYIDKITPSNGSTRNFWRWYYQIIYYSNVILSRIDGENTEFESEEQRNQLKAEAMFIRGNCYRLLGIMFGGVPLVLEEIKEPKRDFVRATRAEVLAQAISDVKFAAENLPDPDEAEDGRVSKGAANHLLAELYITGEQWDNAIAAATAVIDDPNYELMTERFGTRQSEPGDVYWDLFRIGNQNRKSSVNKEAIWVCQYEYDVTGGGRSSNYPQFGNPHYTTLQGKDGIPLFDKPMAAYGGRGIGWFAPNNFLINEVWDDPADMRNSEYNIYRDIKATNPASAYYGKYIVADDAIDQSTARAYNRGWSAIMVKITPVNNLPDEYYIDKERGTVINSGPQTFRDHYFMRLAETYLLRAEAYLGKGDKTNAAADINVIRGRAQATPVDEADVDIDYILDERVRELAYEEFRTVTLMRTKKLAERVKKYNPMYNGTYATNGVEEYHNLYPIPADEIENNSEAVLEQNPGYN